jgi:hypothetical protein
MVKDVRCVSSGNWGTQNQSGERSAQTITAGLALPLPYPTQSAERSHPRDSLAWHMAAEAADEVEVYWRALLPETWAGLLGEEPSASRTSAAEV